jgi:hypothetical protein
MDKSAVGGALGVQVLHSAVTPLIQRHPKRLLMTSMNFIGLGIHKKTITYCVNDATALQTLPNSLPEVGLGITDNVLDVAPGSWATRILPVIG